MFASPESQYILSESQSNIVVQIQPTCASDRNKLHGDYHVIITPSHLTLTDIQSGKEVIKWPIKYINRFKSEDLRSGQNLVILEASVYVHSFIYFSVTQTQTYSLMNKQVK